MQSRRPIIAPPLIVTRVPSGITRRTVRRAFTLLETSLAITIIGTGLIAVLQLLAAGTLSNEAATDLTTAVNLANNIHEITIRLPLIDPAYPSTWNPQLSNVANYAGVSEFDGSTFSPPLDVSRNAITTCAGWSQVITVQSVSDSNLNTTIANSTTEWTARVTVKILNGGRVVYETSWLVTATPP